MARAHARSSRRNPVGYNEFDRKASTAVRRHVGSDHFCSARDRNRGIACGRLLCMHCGSRRYLSAIDTADRLLGSRRGCAFVTVGLAFLDAPDQQQLSMLRGGVMQRLMSTVSVLDWFSVVGAFELVPIDLDQHPNHRRTAIDLGHSGTGTSWLFHVHFVCRAGRWGRSYPASALRPFFRSAFPGFRVADTKPVPVEHFGRMAGYAFKGVKTWMIEADPDHLRLLHGLDVGLGAAFWPFELVMGRP